MKRLIAIAFLALPLCSNGQSGDPPRGPGAAGIPAGIFAAGTTALDTAGKPWGYVFITAPEMDSIAGKHFAVHLKPAAADAAGVFTLQGVAAAHQETAVVSGFIERALKLGEQRADLEMKVRALFRSVKYPHYLSLLHTPPEPGDPPYPEDPPQAGEPGTAEQLASVVRRAATDHDIAASLRQLSTGSPAIAMACGLAWGGPLDVAVGQEVTLEIRLFDPVACVDIGVVGRVSFLAGQAQPLPAPGEPVEVPDLTQTGHLNIKLRWSQPDDLRRKSLLSLGFNLYRMPEAFAISQGYDVGSPNTAALLQLASTQPGNVRRINTGALFASKLYSTTDIADFTSDPRTFFLIDDNDRSKKNAAGQALGAPFADGATYRYFVTARDLLGRDGDVSQGGAAIACHRLPPPAPTGLAAVCEHEFDEANQVASDPMILSWTANAPDNPELVTSRYEIIRGLSTGDPQIGGNVNDGANLERYTPSLLVPFASVLHGQQPTFTDPSPCVSAAGNTCWYVVRAVFDGACGPIYSDPSPPIFACIRKTGAPLPPPICSTDTNVPLAAVALQSSATEAGPAGAANIEYRVRATCRRENAGVVWAQFRLRRGTVQLEEPVRVYFPAEFDSAEPPVETEFLIRTKVAPANATLECTVGTDAGAESGIATANFSFVAAPSRRVLNFTSCACSMSDPPPTGALRNQLVASVPLGSASVGTNGNGYTVYNVLASEDAPVVLQRFSGGQWLDRGSAFVAMGKVAVPTGAGEAFRALRILAAIPPAQRCSHQRVANGGGLVPVPLRVCMTEGTNEYRIYRRIDDGPTTLIAQGEGPYASATVKEISHEDGSLPVSSGRAVYFAQMIDRNGNASPLAQIAQCVNLVATPPTPVLQEPKPLLENGVAKVSLGWFCPPVGVERFVVFMEPQETGAPPPTFDELLLATIVNVKERHQVFDSRLDARLSVFASNRFSTGRVGGPTFQPGPDFTVTAKVQRNVSYKIWVKAIGTTGGESGPSEQFDFVWRNPPPPPIVGVEPKVPWPARPLSAAVEFHPLVKAEALNHVDYPYDGGFPYPAGVKIGEYPIIEEFDLPHAAQDPLTLYQSGVDPNDYLHLGKPGSKRLLPAVMYRRQVANAVFPEVTGDTIQVSPLVKAIAFERIFIGGGSGYALIFDPFIGFRYRPVPGGPDVLDIFLLDTQPAIEGAAYHYYLVRFRDDGEVDSVVDAGEITIEANF